MIRDDPKFRDLLYVLKSTAPYLTVRVHVCMAEDVLQSCRDLGKETLGGQSRRLLPNESRHSLHASRDVELGYEDMSLKNEMKYSRWPKSIHL